MLRLQRLLQQLLRLFCFMPSLRQGLLLLRQPLLRLLRVLLSFLLQRYQLLLRQLRVLLSLLLHRYQLLLRHLSRFLLLMLRLLRCRQLLLRLLQLLSGLLQLVLHRRCIFHRRGNPCLGFVHLPLHLIHLSLQF